MAEYEDTEMTENFVPENEDAMDEEQIQSIITSSISDAVDYSD